MKLEMLKDPFPASDISWRAQSCGKKNNKFWVMCLAYIDARNVMNRLDDVCGPENWKVIYREMKESFLCGLSIRVNGKWVTKWDGAEETDIEKIKGGISDSFKRAGVCWGIGRYLYSLESAFGIVCDNGAYNAKTKDGEYFKWNPPALPDWALPKKITKETVLASENNNGKKPVTATQAVPTTKKETSTLMTGPTNKSETENRVDLENMIKDMCKYLGWSGTDFVNYSKQEFKKSPKDLTNEELKSILENSNNISKIKEDDLPW